jgi:hypothetical protein
MGRSGTRKDGLKRVEPWMHLGLGLLVGFAFAVLLGASAASAGTVSNDRPLLFSFDGSDTTAGTFTHPEAVAVDDSTGDVYVLNTAGSGRGTGPEQEPTKRVIDKFNAAGEPQNFTAGNSAGKSSLDGSETPGGAFGVEGSFGTGSLTTDLAVDNSGGIGGVGEGEQGRLYVSEANGPIHAFSPGGGYRWTLSNAVADPCGIAVDGAGHLWAIDQNAKRALEFDPSGTLAPAAPIKEVALNPNKVPCRAAVDETGAELYVADSAFSEEEAIGVEKYIGGVPGFELTAARTRALAIDQSSPSGHIFGITGRGNAAITPFFEVTPSGLQVGTFGHDLLGNSFGIGYSFYDPPGLDGPLDRVYVSDVSSGTVKVFGPLVSGTVPDVSCQVSEPVALHSITARCTINPLGLPHTYHFEWKEGTGESWGAAESSPAQSVEPSDSSPHELSLVIASYKGRQIKSNTSYQVRLVGTNTENSLSAYSIPDTTTTLVPPPAEVTGCGVSAVSSSSAHVACTIDPKEEETNWRILATALPEGTQAECEALADGEFTTAEEGTIPAEEPGTVDVAADLADLDSAQSYCVRATAANSGGGGESDLSFRTLAIVPSEAGAAFAAPRTDTSARINARLNPNGEADFQYRFEWSEDGSAWSVLPVHESSLHAREPVVIAEELGGLRPGTTYHYRLGLAENEAGPASSLGEAKTFTTRTQAEIEGASSSSCPNQDTRAAQHTGYLGSCRGIELVNEPDKGNQNASANGPGINTYTASPLSADGEKVLWSVLAGAPKGPSGTEVSFLAKRSASGWSSESVAPPASEQAGGGEFAYLLNAASPGFGSFLFSVRYPTKLSSPALGTAARVREGKQDLLKAYAVQAPNVVTEESVDMSDDGEHVLALNPETSQLEDIGEARVGPPEVEGETVSIMPDGQPSECGLDLATGQSFPGLVGGGIGHAGDRWIARSDASRVYFRAHPNADEAGGGSCSGPWQLYVRRHQPGKAGTTTLIDPGAPEFITTGPDGHRAYFATRSGLDPADTDPSSPDLYRWDEDAGGAGESSCLTCAVKGPGVVEGPAHLAELGGGLNSVLVSRDLSRVYFYSTAQLVNGAGRQGALNLYTLNEGEVRFVAVTGETDALRRGRGPELSSDGKVLLFEAHATPSLTADATAAQCVSPAQGDPPDKCAELYRYDAGDQSLECLSCRQGGVTTHSFGSARISETPNFHLSGDGSTAAFPTKEALLGADVNQDTDLYEWRNGTLHLITDGVSDFQEGASAPWVWALDDDGSNIIFGLVPPRGSLTGFERDGVLNLYDARIGGGFEPPSPPVHCVEDSCQGPLQGAPPVERSASAAFQGHGNLKAGPQRCRKGKVRRHGRCLKTRGKKKKHPQKRADQARGGRG